MSSALQEAVDGFLRYLKVERQLSPLTQSSYARQLAALVAIADEMKLSSWAQLEPAQVRSMAARSRRAGLAASSLALRLSALRSFLDWQVSQGLLSANPAKGVMTPRKARHLPKNIDVDEVNQLLEIDLSDPLAVRDRAMLEVMYGGGLRLSELVNMDCRHVDLDSGEVWVVGKGSKERRIPIGRTAVAWIQHWLPLRETFGGQDDALFLSIRISYDTHLPRICWNPAVTCAPCRSCWVTQTCRRPRSIPISISSIWLRCMTLRIPAPNEERTNEVLSSAVGHKSHDLRP